MEMLDGNFKDDMVGAEEIENDVLNLQAIVVGWEGLARTNRATPGGKALNCPLAC
jgi:hypothetical protein